MKIIFLYVAIFAAIIGFSAWLYSYDQAAKPGGLSSAHEFIHECETCHTPWQGVSDQMCRYCHFFDDPMDLKPEIRFHVAEKHCLQCHTEHLGRGGDIARVDHTLFHPDLLCTDCHFDPHQGNFGDDCRICHGITSWEVEGFSHPPADNRNCHHCHKAPASHHAPELWEQILKGHQIVIDPDEPPAVDECWQCHTTHRWGHLMMDHDL